jgi:hypothetical protein
MISHADMVAKFDVTPMPREDCSLEDIKMFNDELSKPTFTEEFLIGGGTNVLQIYKPGKLLFKGSKYSIFVIEGGKEYSRRNAKIKSRPIQTAKDKLRDAIYAQIATPQIGDADLIPLIDSLLASDKFETKLKG